MIDKLFQMAWSPPFLVLLACVPVYFAFNFNEEYDQIRLFSEQYFDRSDRNEDGWQEMKDCLIDNLSATLGRGNLFFMAACLTLGGAGSLLWMAAASTFCLLLRFLRVTALFHAGDRGAQSETTLVHRGLDARPPSGRPKIGSEKSFAHRGLGAFFQNVMGEQMHFRCGALLGGLWSGVSLTIGILSPSIYFTARAVCGGRRSFWMLSAAFALLCAATFTVMRNSKEVGVCEARSSKVFCSKTKRCLLWTYVLLLSFLLLKNWRYFFMAFTAILTDGFQLPSFVGPMMGKGWGMALACGVCLCCWNSGLLHESGDRRFTAAAKKAGAGSAEAGFWAMLEGLAGIVFAGGLGGALVVIHGISQAEAGMGNITGLVNDLSGGFQALSVLFFLLSLWLGWCGCREEFQILRLGAAGLFCGKGGGRLSAFLYPFLGLLTAAGAALWDKWAPGQFHWLCLLFLPLFLAVVLQVFMAFAVSEQAAAELKSYQRRYWKKGLG